MEDNLTKYTNPLISKRDFLKFGFCGMCSAATYFLGNKSFAESDKLWKWNKEAFYYSSENGIITCRQCPNECVIEKDNTGFCRTRVNKGGKLYSIVYGNPCAVHSDPVEKKPLFHFLPGTRAFSIATAGCNLRCLNCQNWEISQSNPYETKNYDLMPYDVVKSCMEYKCESIAYTYSEPNVFYEYMWDTAMQAKAKGIKNLFHSNGYVNEKPLRNMCKYLDAANVDLKSFDDKIYRKLNGGSLEPILRSLKILHEEKVWLEITCLIIPEWTDDLGMIRRMCQWLTKNGLNECPVHFSRFMPLYKLTQLPSTPVSTLEKARQIALDEGVKYVYIGNVPGSDAENTYCPKCKKIVIGRKGYFIASNDLNNGSCKYCGTKIHGVWNK
jgi:pyruvate formate lyase activating enzyme